MTASLAPPSDRTPTGLPTLIHPQDRILLVSMLGLWAGAAAYAVANGALGLVAGVGVLLMALAVGVARASQARPARAVGWACPRWAWRWWPCSSTPRAATTRATLRSSPSSR